MPYIRTGLICTCTFSTVFLGVPSRLLPMMSATSKPRAIKKLRNGFLSIARTMFFLIFEGNFLRFLATALMRFNIRLIVYQIKTVLSTCLTTYSHVCYNESMKISFYPSTDAIELVEAALEYQKIWDETREEIIKAYQKVSGMSFKTSNFNALVYKGRSFSHPLTLRSNLSLDEKKMTLIHELGHLLMVDNNIKVIKDNNYDLNVHKQLFLILFDVYVELVEKEKAIEQVEKEKKNRQLYVDAWDEALAMTKEQRAHKFNELKKSYENN